MSPSDSGRDGRTDDADEAPGARAPGQSWWSRARTRLPGAAYMRAHRQGVRRVLTGGLGAVVAAAVLLVTAGSVPSGGGASLADAPLRSYAGAGQIASTELSGDDITIAQVLGVLERAHRLAADQGAAMDPEIAQAAAELGMLYTTYQAQEQAREAERRGGDPTAVPEAGSGAPDGVSPEEGAVPPGDPRPGGTEPEDEDGATEPEGKDASRPDERPDDGRSSDGERSTDDDGRSTDERRTDGDGPDEDELGGAGSAADGVQEVDREAAPAAGSGADSGTRAASRPGESLDEPGAGSDGLEARGLDVRVTFDDVAAAALRLARLLDAARAEGLVDPVPAGGAGGSGLRDSLMSIVDAFGLSTAGFANGRIPADVLCPLEFAPGHLLRCDAAERLTALNAKYEERFGTSIPMTDSYRPYEQQVELSVTKPALAAVPGTSNHGWGIAVDLGSPISTGQGAEYAWMRVNGPEYGWDNPVWARPDGVKPEPWHFEFFAAGVIPNRAVDVSDIGNGGDARYRPPLRPKPGDEPDTVPVRDGKGISKGGSGDGSSPDGSSGKGSDKGSDKGKGSGSSGGSGSGDDPSQDPGDGKPPSSKPPSPTPRPTPTPSDEPTDPGPSPSPSEEPSEPGGEPSEPGEPSQEPSEEPEPAPSASGGSDEGGSDEGGSDGDGSDGDGSDGDGSGDAGEPSPSASPKPSASASPSPSPSPSSTARATSEPEPKATDGESPEPEPTPTLSPSRTPSASPTPSPGPSEGTSGD